MAQYGFGLEEESKLHDADSKGDTRIPDSGREALHDREKKVCQQEGYNDYNGEPENATKEPLEDRNTDAPVKDREREWSKDVGLTEGGPDSIGFQQYGTEKVSPDTSFDAPGEQYGQKEYAGMDAPYNVSSGTGYELSDFPRAAVDKGEEKSAIEEGGKVADSNEQFADEGIVPKQDSGMGVNHELQEPTCTQYGRQNDSKERDEGYEPNMEEQKESHQSTATEADEPKYSLPQTAPMEDNSNEKDRQPDKLQVVKEKIKETLLPCHNTPTKDDEDEVVQKQEGDQPAAKSHWFVDKFKEKVTSKPQADQPADKEDNLHGEQQPNEPPKKGLLGKIKEKLYLSP